MWYIKRIYNMEYFETNLTHLTYKRNIVNKYNANPIYQPLRSGRIWHKVNF